MYMLDNEQCLKYKTMGECINDVNCVPCKSKNKCLNINQYNNYRDECSNFHHSNTNIVKDYKKQSLIGTPLREKCNSICNNNEFCLRYERDLKHFNKCEKCHKLGKCYKILDTNSGVCEICNPNNKDQYQCNNTRYLGCPRPNDINNFDGIKPYFVLIKSNNISDIYGTKCNLCK